MRAITERDGTLLIFDEVMTGFRLAFGGAQELNGIRPDLTTMGKIIGGGLPVGGYGGPSEIMDLVAPLGQCIKRGRSREILWRWRRGWLRCGILNRIRKSTRGSTL